MPRAATRIRPSADATAANGLLATKLYVPRQQPGFVPRPRLIQQLDEGLARGLILVCASAGYGKTSMLADWARRGQHQLAWLSLDAGDNDPARFWRYVVAALEHSRPGVAERVVPLLGPPPPLSFDSVATALINELATGPDVSEVLMVLDDYQVIDSPAVHDAVAFLLEHRPLGLRLVLASRADPPLPLARLRARGQLAELRDTDLRFTAAEAAALLREALGPDLRLEKAAVTALAARTEGWAAGLQLAALSLRNEPDIAGFVATFSGSHRYVLDYLTEEVLERQSDAVRDFLLQTSVLDRLSGELCDAVTGHGGGQRMLETLERENLFLVPLDEVRGWWRYHHLFAELLRVRLKQKQPERLIGLHRNAAGWCAPRGLVDDAVGHALAAGDALWAAQLIEQYIDERMLRSERTTLERWFAALPAELVNSRPRLLLIQTIRALIGGRVDDAEPLLDQARIAAAIPGSVDEPYHPSAGVSRSLVANVPAMLTFGRAFLAEVRGDADQTIVLAGQALTQLGESPSTLGSLIRAHLGIAEWLRGRLPDAERALTQSIAELRAAGETYLTARMNEPLGQVRRAQGDLEAARATYQLALDITVPRGHPPVPAAGIPHVGMAEVAYQRGDFETARAHLTAGVPLCRQLTNTPPLAAGLATLAWIRHAEGDTAGALTAMDEAVRVVPSPRVVSLINPVPAQRARLLLARGDIEAASGWVATRGIGPDDQPDYPREPDYLVLARCLIAQQLSDQALGLLERIDALAVAQDRTGSLIEVRTLRALALASRGDHAAAGDLAADALSLASGQGYVRVFADEGDPMQAVLVRVGAERPAGVPLDYLARLMRAFQPPSSAEPSAGRPSAAGVPGLVEPLSSREVEVLRLLATGKQNQEIADELVVALSTVKKHVTHIFDKLGATNRTEATMRAREFGLLP
jgi:LuxR family maltose regulon positive regulatory protein